MPHASLQLHLPQPCAESWDAMTPSPGGRHCAACQKVVVDFRQKTDAELLAYFRQAAGQPICGQLRPDQLGHPLHLAAPASRWRVWLASALALGGTLGASRATAQSRNVGLLPQDTAVAVVATSLLADAPPHRPLAAPASASPASRVVLRGRVLDATTGQSLPGVGILLKDTSFGTSTNADGQFELTVDQAGPLTLRAEFIGYTSVEQLITDPGRPLELALRADLKGGIGFTVVPPAPWHPRSLYYWGKYWLTRPFHR